jgi:broad specificity phosphatase PhoE
LPNLILIRHSVPKIEKDVPAKEWHLSQEGMDRCMYLADTVRRYSPDKLFSSNEVKAKETAQLIASNLNNTYQIIDGLHEQDRGSLKWLDRSKFIEMIHKGFRNPESLIFGNETANQANNRFTHTIKSLMTLHPQCSLAVVTHGTVITLFVAEAVGIEPYSFWNGLGIPSVIVLSFPPFQLVEVVNKIGIDSLQ